MLLRALFLCLAIATLGETLLAGAHALAQTALHRRALAALHTALTNAATAAQLQIAASAAAGNDPSFASPPPQSNCAHADDDGCAMTALAQMSFATPLPSPSETPCAGNCGAYLQGNDAVGEGRLYANVQLQVQLRSGETIARRAATLAFRTFRVPPYAALDGSR